MTRRYTTEIINEIGPENDIRRPTSTPTRT